MPGCSAASHSSDDDQLAPTLNSSCARLPLGDLLRLIRRLGDPRLWPYAFAAANFATRSSGLRGSPDGLPCPATSHAVSPEWAPACACRPSEISVLSRERENRNATWRQRRGDGAIRTLVV
jgi:hypothetical protein